MAWIANLRSQVVWYTWASHAGTPRCTVYRLIIPRLTLRVLQVLLWESSRRSPLRESSSWESGFEARGTCTRAAVTVTL